MGNQIIELAQQAGYSKDFLALGLPSNLERFAELIVKECATWIDKQPGWDGPYGYELLNHFGVEE